MKKFKFITWQEKLGLKECPFMERWIINFYFFSIRLHHWLASDDGRHYHNHPWWFWTWVIVGEYTDYSLNGLELMKRWTLKFRLHTHSHTVHIKENTWTIVLTGKHKRDWGFWVDRKFVKSNKYFHSIGHHPCNEGEKRQRTSERV